MYWRRPNCINRSCPKCDCWSSLSLCIQDQHVYSMRFLWIPRVLRHNHRSIKQYMRSLSRFYRRNQCTLSTAGLFPLWIFDMVNIRIIHMECCEYTTIHHNQPPLIPYHVNYSNTVVWPLTHCYNKACQLTSKVYALYAISTVNTYSSFFIMSLMTIGNCFLWGKEDYQCKQKTDKQFGALSYIPSRILLYCSKSTCHRTSSCINAHRKLGLAVL